MYGFYCIAFIKYIHVGKTLLNYTNLFSSNGYKKNGKIIYKYFKGKKGRRRFEFRLRKIDGTKNYVLAEVKHDLTSKNYNKACKYLNYVEHLFILVSTITSCVSISVFASLVDIPIGITGSVVGTNICAIIAGIKKYKPIIKKKKKIMIKECFQEKISYILLKF